jgi:hypothetical protein
MTYRAHVDISGQVVVNFRGDPAAGCEATFRCDVESGSIRWTPQSEGQLYLTELGRGRLFSALNVIGFGGGTPGTIAVVRRRAADGSEQMCIEGRNASFEGLPVSVVGKRSLRFGLRPARGPYPPQTLLPTRCGGPLVTDLIRGLPTRTVPLRTLLRGPTKIDLAGSTAFAAGGLAGTAVSTLVVKVGEMRARRARTRRRPPRPRGGRPPIRTAQLEYRVTGVSGSVPLDVLADPRACAPLDACGLAGSLTVTPRPDEGEVYLLAYGRHPKETLRRALRGAPGPIPRGVRLYGYGTLSNEAGSVAAALERDGRPACRDTVPLRRSTLGLRVRRGQVTVVLGSDQFGSDMLVTRCPGPLGADVGRARGLARARLALSAFSRRRVTLHLDRGMSRTTPGFQLRSRPDLKIELEREID